MGGRPELARGRQRVGTTASLPIVGRQLVRDAGHKEHIADKHRSGPGSRAQRSSPLLHSAIPVECVEQVVKRGKEHPLFVRDWRANDVASGAPVPIHRAFVAGQPVQVVVRRAHEQRVERQNLAGQATKVLLPDLVAGQQVEGEQATVIERDQEPVSAERWSGVKRALEGPPPDLVAVRRPERDQLTLGQRENKPSCLAQGRGRRSACQIEHPQRLAVRGAA